MTDNNIWMWTALEYATRKQRDCYAETDKAHGDLYAIATIMAPQNKLDYFSSGDWNEPYRKQYRVSLDRDLYSGAGGIPH